MRMYLRCVIILRWLHAKELAGWMAPPQEVESEEG